MTQKFPIEESLREHLHQGLTDLLARPINPQEALDFRPIYPYQLRLQRRFTKSGKGHSHIVAPILSRYSISDDDPFLLSKWCTDRLRRYLAGAVKVSGLPLVGHLILQHFLGILASARLGFAN